MAMTLQRAIAAFSGPRTYKAGDGSIRRTTAWENYLRANGLGSVLTSASGGIGTVPAGTPAPVGYGTLNPQPESHADPVSAFPTATAPAPTPTPPPPPRPTINDFSSYQDSTYFSDLGSYKRQYDDANAELSARLARLNSRIDPTTGQVVTNGVGGKTLYDLMYDQQNSTLARNVSLSRSDAARRGLLRSGYMDRTLTGVAADDIRAKDDIVRQYGYEGLRGANGELDMRAAGNLAVSERNRLQQQFEEAQRLLAQSASQRGLENALAQYQQMYAPIGGN